METWSGCAQQSWIKIKFHIAQHAKKRVCDERKKETNCEKTCKIFIGIGLESTCISLVRKKFSMFFVQFHVRSSRSSWITQIWSFCVIYIRCTAECKQKERKTNRASAKQSSSKRKLLFETIHSTFSTHTQKHIHHRPTYRSYPSDPFVHSLALTTTE